MSILSRVKSTVKKVASGIKSGFQNAVKGDFSNLKKNVSSAVKTVSGLASKATASASSARPTSNTKIDLNKVSSISKALGVGNPFDPKYTSVANSTRPTTNKSAASAMGISSGGTSSYAPTKTSSAPVRQSSAPKVANTGTTSTYSSPTYSAPQLSKVNNFSSVFSGGVDSFSMPISTPAMRAQVLGAGANVGVGDMQPNPNSTDQQNQNIDLKKLKFPTTGPGTLPLSQVLAALQSGKIQNVRGLEPTMSSPKVPSTVASNQLGITPQDVLARRGEMAGATGNLASMQASLENAQQMLDQYKAQQDALNPPVPDPIEDTPEQQDWLAQFQQQDKVNIQQELDQFKQDIGLTQVTAQRIDIMKQLNATNEVYMKIIDDIKANPELPTALAQRRMNEAYDQQKGIVLQLTGQYDVLNEQERILNDQVNQKYQILKDEQQQQQDQEKRLYDILNFMVDGGSISAMTDSELKAISARLGVPLSALKDVRSQTLKERTNKNQKTTIYSTDQGLVALTQDSAGNVIGTTNVLPKAGGGGVVTTTAANAPTFEQYVALAEKALTSMSGGALPVKLGTAERAALKQQYDAKYTTTSGGAKFTPSEQKKLEYAGLSNASRQVQLEYLYGDSGGSASDLFNSL